jgi:hypothetical protein
MLETIGRRASIVVPEGHSDILERLTCAGAEVHLALDEGGRCPVELTFPEKNRPMILRVLALYRIKLNEDAPD